jgi:general secretion pathway protein H
MASQAGKGRMPTSINSSQSQGFTLMELLVVMLLLGLGIGVSLTVDVGGSPQQQKQQAVLLANALELAAQDAVLDRRTLGLDFFRDDGRVAYRWLQQEAAAWKPYVLQDATEAPLAAAVTATLRLDGQDVQIEPRADLAATTAFAPEILLLPTREVTPFTLTLEGDAGDASVLTADVMGRVRVDEDAPTPP